MNTAITQNSQEFFPLTQLPEDTWGHLLFFHSIEEIKVYRLVSKVFGSLVEVGCQRLCTHYQMIKESEDKRSSFRRIIDLGSLIRNWTHANDFAILEGNKAYARHLLAVAGYGINPFHYSQSQTIEYQNEAYAVARAVVAKTCEKSFSSSSIQDFLKSFSPGLEAEVLRYDDHMTFDNPFNSRVASAFLLMILANGIIFPNHPAKMDFICLLVNCVKFDPLPNDPLHKITDQDIENTIVSYIFYLKVKELKNVFNEMQESATINKRRYEKITKQYPEFQNILNSAPFIDDEELFVKCLLCFKDIVQKCINFPINYCEHLTHMSENGSLIKKFLEIYPAPEIATNAFHYANTKAVAQALFDAIPQYLHVRMDNRSPLLTALLQKNIEVAEFLVSKNCTLKHDDSKTLVRLLFSKGPIKGKWIVLKELISRVARVAFACFLLINVIFGIVLLSYGLYKLITLPIFFYDPKLWLTFTFP